MTRQEFINDIADIGDAALFIINELDSEFDGCYYMSDESYNEYVFDNFVMNATDYSYNWEDVLSRLEDLPRYSDYCWFVENQYDGEFVGIDYRDFLDLKQNLLDYLDGEEWFDPEEVNEDEDFESDLSEPTERPLNEMTFEDNGEDLQSALMLFEEDLEFKVVQKKDECDIEDAFEEEVLQEEDLIEELLAL